MMARHLLSRITVVLLATMFIAGCDKCGDRLKLNMPSLPAACGANADPAR